MASLFPDGTLKYATCTSTRNSVEFNQSDDDFKTLEVFPVCRMHQTFSQRSVGVTSEAETRSP